MITAIERLIAMAENEQLRADPIATAIQELQDVREWAAGLSLLADALDEADGTLDAWSSAEGREERVDAREDLMASLQNIADAHYDLTALPPMNLGPEVTP